MFSIGDFDVGDNYKLHGSVQCPRDLSSLDYMKCLNDSIGFIPKCCNLSKGVQIFSVTCDLRFETFYHKLYPGSAVLEVTRILQFGISNLSFSRQNSDPDQTTSKINNIGFDPIWVSHSRSWLIASSSLWNRGT
ncbi:cysteine-rich repeat secretory protein 38 [Quercus suber]|uniref:Cysteine-rich repeat secretory protein 38 n=1 Tax=Quercus suber TaxID=58331 RepID=A0AAW0JLQ4_QUESU